MTKEKYKLILIGLLYIFASFFLIFLVFRYGIKLAVEISLFFQKKGNDQQEEIDIVPPPILSNIPQATNSSLLKITGFSMPNQKVHIYLNDLEVKSIETDSEGKFEEQFSLTLGNNKIYTVAENAKRIKSEPSSSWVIFFSDSPPYLEIIEPQNGSVLKKTQNPLEIKGKSSYTSKVYINDQRVILDNDGNFNYQVLLNKGENKFKILAIDPAENRNEVELTLYYQP